MPRLESYPSPNCWWSSFVCPWRTRGSAFSSYFLPTPALNSNSRILVHAGAYAAGKGLHHQRHGHLVGDDEPCGVFGVISWSIDKHIYLCMFYIHLLLIVLSTCNFIEIFEVWASILPVDIIYWRWWYLCNIFGLRYMYSIRYFTFLTKFFAWCIHWGHCRVRKIWLCPTTNCQWHHASGSHS